MHCNKGVSRSSSMVVAYLMKLHSMTFEQALAFVVARRAIANPNESFCRQLQEYGRRLQRSRPKSARGGRGLVGPQRPPAEDSAAAAAIGPQLPPHLLRAQESDKAATNTKARTQDANEKVIHGPNVCPNPKRERMPSNELNEEDTTTSTKKKKIENSN